MISKKLFVKGINQDDSHVLVDTNEYLNALNIRFATTENGKVGQLANVEGNVVKNNSNAFTLPEGTNTTIGAWEDTPNRRVIFFNKNSNTNDGIYCYDADTDFVYTVLLATQVVGGLNFTTPIHSVSMVGNLIYWTDGVNPQRRINVEAGIKMNHVSYSTTVSPYVLDQSSNTKMLASVITLIRNQPAFPLTASKIYDSTYSNNLVGGEAFQFAYRFVYRDYEVSTFSPLSTLINYNTSTETFNAVDITIPATQKIPQDVIKIEVAVKFVVGGKYSIIKSFTSGFSSHNTGTLLTFRFFNDTIGIAVDDASSVKQFDSIPLRSGTLEIAKNRLFLGNNYDGYESPKSTSLGVSPVPSGGATVTGVWCRLVYGVGGGSEVTLYLLDVTGISPDAGYYEPNTPPTPPSFPTSVAWNTLNYRGAGLSNVLSYLGVTFQDVISFTAGLGNATVTGYSGTITSIVGQKAFKSDSSYRLGVVFYDQAGRKCGVVTNDAAKVVTQDRNYSTVSYTTEINWTLTNSTNQSTLQAEIPDWAYYYSVVMTKCLRTNFFIQSRTPDLTYIKKSSTGEYVTDNSYNEKHFGVGISLNSLTGYGQGYSYQAGDICKLYPSSGAAPFILKVKDTFAEYVIVDLKDLGSLSSSSDIFLFEIYTPYSQSFDELYYERGAVYPVNNAGLSNRSYSTITGSFKGDITMLERSLSATTYLVEAMSPNDLYWQRWNTDAGRASIIISSKPSNKNTSVYWSNVIVPGTETNGLSTFDALDQKNLPLELNSIQKLSLVSKVESEGTVMLAIGEQETAAIYLGEAQIIDNTGNSFLASSSGVIGNINVMRGSYGTINPESVVRYMGEIYWFDANKGSVVRYSSNGLFPISANKMQKYFRKVGQDVLTKKLSFYGGIDPYHNEVLMFAPRKSAVPEGARLLDMTLSSNTYNFTTIASASTITVVGQANYPYSGGQLGPTQATVTGSTGAVTFTYTGVSGTAYGPSSVRPSQAGSYQVVASVASDGIYDAATSAPFNFTISAAFVFDADYMLLTYQFSDGNDLDTRTRIVTPNVGQDAQPKYVGWGVSQVWPTTGTPLLDWGGDNTGTGFESVLINVAQLKSSYPSATTLVVDLRAFWYSSVGVQPVNVAATLWKGGTPIEQGSGGSPAFSFTNPTATAVLNISSVGKQITSDGSPSKSASSGERVATLTYNLVTNSGSFNSNDTTTPSV